MIAASLMMACVAAAVALLTKGWQAWTWHHRGWGERAAHAEYARMRREHTDTAEARLPEAEFVRYYVGLRPGATRYLIAVLLLLVAGLPGSCALKGGWPWN